MTDFDALSLIAAAAESTTRGPVPRTPVLRAALRQLLARATGPRWPFDQLWNEVGDPMEGAYSDGAAGNFRHSQCHAALRGIMRAVGYSEDIDGWDRLMKASRVLPAAEHV